MSDRILVLMRHAKAADGHAIADLQRALTSRGQADAAEAGRWITAQRLVPDILLCSPARRARETWHGLAATLGAEACHTRVVYEPALYTASIGEELLTLINSTNHDSTTLMVIGHNPTLSMLSTLLDPTAKEALRTCGIAVHEVTGEWHDLAPGAAPCSNTHTPRLTPTAAEDPPADEVTNETGR